MCYHFIVSKFLNLLYENADYYLKPHQIQRIQNDTFGIDASQEKIVAIYKIYHYIVQELFNNYGIGNSEADFVLNRCQKKRRKWLRETDIMWSVIQVSEETIQCKSEKYHSLMRCIWGGWWQHFVWRAWGETDLQSGQQDEAQYDYDTPNVCRRRFSKIQENGRAIFVENLIQVQYR